MADWLQMPFGVVSGVGLGTEGCIRWGGDCRRGMGSFGGECGTSHCNQWGLCGIVILCHEGGDTAFPNYFGVSFQLFIYHHLFIDGGSTAGSCNQRRDVHRPNVAGIQTVDVVPDVGQSLVLLTYCATLW